MWKVVNFLCMHTPNDRPSSTITMAIAVGVSAILKDFENVFDLILEQRVTISAMTTGSETSY